MLLKRFINKLRGRREPVFLNQQKHLQNFDIGDYSHGHLNVLTWTKSGGLHIGKYCSFAENVTIMLGGEHRIDWVSTYAFPTLFEKAKGHPGWPKLKGDTVVGNDVWVGRDSIILSGVTIGDGAIIGAGSVVRKDVKPYAIVTGNPAIFTGFRFDRDVIADLIDMQWWNWPIEKIEEALPLMLTTDIRQFIEAYKNKPEQAGQDIG